MKNLFASVTFLFSFTCLFAQVEQATLLSNWQGDNLVGSAAFDNTYNEIWGIAVNNREFAVIGSTAGTHFIDVTDPRNPVEVQFVEGAVSGTAIIHRDYHDNGCFLYIVADEPTSINAADKSTLQIVDIGDLPNSVEVVYDSDELIFRSHNIFIDEPNNRMYACIANGTADPGFSAMRVYDISEPANPIVLSKIDAIGGLNIQQVHDGYFIDNIAYLNLGPGGFAVADFTDPATPILLGTLDNYPEQGYNHSGWLAPGGDYYYMADETHGMRMKVVDVSDFTDMEVVGFMDAGNSADTSIPHNQVVACDYLYVSYYYDGLQVYDISNPATPVRVLEYDTSNEPDDDNFKGAWGVYPFLPSGNILVADMQEGLFVFEAIDNSNCTQRRQICEGVPTSTSAAINETGFTISPNPAKDFLKIEFSAELAVPFEISILDITGKNIMTASYKNTESSISMNLPSSIAEGIYIVSIATKDTVFSRKLIIE